MRPQQRGQHTRHLGLAHAWLALQQKWLVALERQEDGGRQPAIGDIALARQRIRDLVYRRGGEASAGLRGGLRRGCAVVGHGDGSLASPSSGRVASARAGARGSTHYPETTRGQARLVRL